MRRVSKLLSQFWSPDYGPYPLLVLLFVTLFVLAPLLSAHLVVPFVMQIAFALIIVAGAFSVSSRTSVRSVAIAFAVLSVASRWLEASFAGKTMETADLLVSVGMLSVFTLLLVNRFVVQGHATHRIAGAVAVYLLIGLIWARLYEFVEVMSPGAFRIPEGESVNPASFAYFSFVTLATLGYGDITPINIVARDLAVIEAMMGQLYLVILISRLVSERVAGKEQ